MHISGQCLLSGMRVEHRWNQSSHEGRSRDLVIATCKLEKSWDIHLNNHSECHGAGVEPRSFQADLESEVTLIWQLSAHLYPNLR